MKPDFRKTSNARPHPRSARAPAPHTALRVTHRFNAPAQRIFDAWLDPGIVGQWLFATAWQPMTQVEIDARVAGTFRLADQSNGERIEFCGEYIEILPPRRLVFSLAAADTVPAATRVTVEIASRRQGCELVLVHENVPAAAATATEQRWIGILYGLGVTLEALPAAPSHRLNGSALERRGK